MAMPLTTNLKTSGSFAPIAIPKPQLGVTKEGPVQKSAYASAVKRFVGALPGVFPAPTGVGAGSPLNHKCDERDSNSQTEVLVFEASAFTNFATVALNIRSSRRDLNPRPTDYKSVALPLSYASISFLNFFFHPGAPPLMRLCTAAPVTPRSRPTFS